MQLQDYTKILILDFINKSNKMFDFKTLRIVLLVTLRLYDQRRQLDILVKDATISRNIAFERVKQLKRRYLKVIQLFWFLKQSIKRMMNQWMSGEVGFLNSLVSHFFIEKMFFSAFVSFKAKFFLKKKTKHAICTLQQ